ncbi:MAG: SDR family NAD(P)-dependent oxidoreductase, partial [Oscillospiraceae bacterium]|nr:SDR family NAD(P)-dependent oxidoreductase [Oscillospiraceae bacterium]
MSNVCIITGCSSAAGLEAARKADQDAILVLAGNQSEELDQAKASFEAEGREVHAFAADVSVRREAHAVFAQANLVGTIKTVIHIPQPLPETADVETIIRVNSIGVKNVNMESRKYMGEGGTIVDVVAGDAEQAPDILARHKIFEKAEYEEDKFMKDMVREAKLAIGDEKESEFAYLLSSSFTRWYA